MKARPREKFDSAAPLYTRRTFVFRGQTIAQGDRIDSLPLAKRKQLHRIERAQHAVPVGIKPKAVPVAVVAVEAAEAAESTPAASPPAAPSAGHPPSSAADAHPQPSARTDAQATSNAHRKQQRR